MIFGSFRKDSHIFEQGKFALVFYPMNRKTPKAVATIMA